MNYFFNWKKEGAYGNNSGLIPGVLSKKIDKSGKTTALKITGIVLRGY
jgi:hypothetical protein